MIVVAPVWRLKILIDYLYFQSAIKLNILPSLLNVSAWVYESEIDNHRQQYYTLTESLLNTEPFRTSPVSFQITLKLPLLAR